MNKNNKVPKHIDFSMLPKYETGAYEGKINWKNSIGYTVNFEYGDIVGKLEIIDVKKGKYCKVIVIKYKEIISEINVTSFSKGELGCILGVFSLDYKYNIGDNIIDDKRDITIIKQMRDEKNKRKKYMFKCNKCGWDCGDTLEIYLDDGYICACCTGRRLVVGINDIPTTAPWMIKYFQGGYEEAKQYTRQSHKKIYPICPDCLIVKSKTLHISSIYRSNSIGCGCGDGKKYPEKFMACVLNQLNVEYEWGFTANWLKGYNGSTKSAELDFFLKHNNVVIEMDGKLGHGRYVMPSSKITVQETLEKDIWKDEQAKKQGLTVIRINACESSMNYLMRNIVDSLHMYYDLNNINWFECDKFARTNKVKEVCLHYENNTGISMQQLSELFDLATHTIGKYLKIGGSLGWCSYTVEDAIKKKSEKMVQHTMEQKTKKIDVYNYFTGKFIRQYQSIIDLSRQSKIDFGKNITCSSIIAVAKERKDHYVGLVFKYANINNN